MSQSEAARISDRTRSIWIILLCFFASGFSGLVYQVIWVRELVLVFGATTFAVSTVLTAFMGGLALGSFYFGRRSEKVARPLQLYGWIEIGIGLYGLAVPIIFALLPNVYHFFWERLQVSFFALSLIRFLFAALILVLPTALMGATLPVLSAYYARDLRKLGFRVGSLYSINTFGAVLGAASTGFFLIPLLGMRAATVTAAAINILLGIASLALSRRYESGDSVSESNGAEEETIEASKPKVKRKSKTPAIAQPKMKYRPSEESLGRSGIIAVFVSFALSGFIALSYEVIWSRVLALIIGSSVYAFSIMLTTFLTGLAVGASIASRFVDRIRRPVTAFALLEIGVGLTSIIGASLFNELPYTFVQLYGWMEDANFALLLFARFLIASMVMVVPTLLLGSLFPLVVRICGDARGMATGRTVGDAYAANTVGAIVGSFASGFVLIPWLGLLGSLRLASGLNFFVSAILFIAVWKNASETHKSRRIRPALAGLMISASLIVLVTVFAPSWDSEIMSSAVYRYAPSLNKLSREQFNDYARKDQGETIYYNEGVTATIAVQQKGNGRVLKANGKPEASTAGDMPTQILIGSLPLLVREKTDNVLVIGLGSGVTLGSVEQFPIERVTCVELEPAMIEASDYFNSVNNRPLEDPRLRMIANDGRNFIYTTGEKFDVIVSEPSNPWLTGVANLFTLEYFKRGADCLTEDGLFSQWLQIYEMSPEDVKILVATFKAAFPHVYIFRGAEGDLMLLGSKRERKIDLSVIASHFNNPKVAIDHARINTDSATDIISRLYLGPEELSGFADNAPINTDNNALIEFSAPRRVGTAEETVLRNVSELLAHAASPIKYMTGIAPHKLGQAELMAETGLCAVRRSDHGRAEQFVSYSLALTETPTGFGMLGELQMARKDESAAMESWKRALALNPDHFYSLINMGKLYLTRQDTPRATPYLDRAIKINPESARAHHLRGLAFQASGDHTRAALEYRKTLPDAQYVRSIDTFYLNFGTALEQIGLYEEAAQMLEQFIHLKPNDFDGHFQLGAVYEKISSYSFDEAITRRAAEELKLALSIRPNYSNAHYLLSRIYRRLGLDEQADAEFELYERFSP